MAGADEILAAIEAIHAAGLDAELWSPALAAIVRVIGGIGATMETYDTATMRLDEFRGVGLPPAQETAYLADFMAINPRIASILKLKPGSLIWDRMVLDEREMNRDAFYSDFLPLGGLRYFIGAGVPRNDHMRSFVTIQRTPSQGHVDHTAIAHMRVLLPHVQQAMDVTRRLRDISDVRHSLERALDWLADGVALINAKGKVTYANEAFQDIVRRNDVIVIKKGRIELAAADDRERLDHALSNVMEIRGGTIRAVVNSDFRVGRSDGGPSYFLSVRPLLAGAHDRTGRESPIAILFVRDPSRHHAATIAILRSAFGFTAAEAALAQALQAGVLLNEYAQTRAVSLNTIYTHLRRLKEKTGCNRTQQLIAKLNDLKVSLRVD
jgi:PAS domain-containing protein/DNA-binding CsgD family transcriptional regulator